MSFNQREYINQYRKEHYSKLSVDLSKKEKQELIDICNRDGLSIKQFIVNSIQEAKKKRK